MVALNIREADTSRAYRILDARLRKLTQKQAAIADVPTGGSATTAANATAINDILAVLRALDVIET